MPGALAGTLGSIPIRRKEVSPSASAALTGSRTTGLAFRVRSKNEEHSHDKGAEQKYLTNRFGPVCAHVGTTGGICHAGCRLRRRLDPHRPAMGPRHTERRNV